MMKNNMSMTSLFFDHNAETKLKDQISKQDKSSENFIKEINRLDRVHNLERYVEAQKRANQMRVTKSQNGVSTPAHNKRANDHLVTEKRPNDWIPKPPLEKVDYETKIPFPKRKMVYLTEPDQPKFRYLRQEEDEFRKHVMRLKASTDKNLYRKSFYKRTYPVKKDPIAKPKHRKMDTATFLDVNYFEKEKKQYPSPQSEKKLFSQTMSSNFGHTRRVFAFGKANVQFEDRKSDIKWRTINEEFGDSESGFKLPTLS